MIDLPSSEVIAKIVEQTDLSKEQVEEKIKEKLQQLSGLISEDGAAHIVANDLKIQLYKTQGAVKIKELSQNAKNTNITGKVLQKYEAREFDKNGRQGKVANLLLGDETGNIRVVFWNDQVDLFEKVNQGDILQIENPYIKENMDRLEVHLNDRSNVKTNPEGVAVEVPERTFEAPKSEMKYLKDVTGTEASVEVLGTIVQVYNPRYFTVCPECNKRLKEDNSCATHGAVTPMTNYVTTCLLDDGTANLRTTFWKKETQDLFQKSDAEILSWEQDQSKIQDPKNDLLGEIIKVVARPRKNEQYGQIELTANKVITDVDPSKELARLGEEEPATEVKETQEEPSSETTPELEQESKDEVPKEALHEVEEAINEPEIKSEPEREVKPEDVKFTGGDEIQEEVIDIDDLEDL